MKHLVIMLALVSALQVPEPYTYPPDPAEAARVWAWWVRHIKGFRPDRSRRWDPRGRVLEMDQIVPAASASPLPPPDGLPPVRDRLPEMPAATPAPLPTPGWP